MEVAMRERLMAEMRAALKAQDKPRLSALRLISAALQQADIAAKSPIPDAEIPALLQRMIKQRRESLAFYQQAGRQAQADQEAAEITVIEAFLPKQMSEAEAQAAVATTIKEVGAASRREMGKVMSALKERYAGRLDFAKASGWVKDWLK
jgi:uncharacterized protein YqeY